jgi:hypothetical protein
MAISRTRCGIRAFGRWEKKAARHKGHPMNGSLLGNNPLLDKGANSTCGILGGVLTLPLHFRTAGILRRTLSQDRY